MSAVLLKGRNYVHSRRLDLSELRAQLPEE
jgi:hypothetical protein